MAPHSRQRELLSADLAVSHRLADGREAAAALEKALTGATAVEEELQRAGVIDDSGRARLREALEEAVAASDGDVRAALVRRGGIDRSIHAGLGRDLSEELLREGTGVRSPLRSVAPDRYQSFELVGKGGMGVVYLALDTELNRRVAFKMVRPDPGGPADAPASPLPLDATPPSVANPETTVSFEELKLRLLQEAWITGALEHPGVVPVYELGRTDAGIPYYTMRYVKGERTLADAISGAKTLDDRLALLESFLKACDALRFAHARRIVHRDLKPDNIALGEVGETFVHDWGLSRLLGKPDLSAGLWQARIRALRGAEDFKATVGALGTPGYMAPEAALGEIENVDGRSDIYSLGSILFQILTGRLAFEFEDFVGYVRAILNEEPPDATAVEPSVPEELSRICARALAREKDDRFDTVDDLAAQVRRWQTEGALEREMEVQLERAQDEFAAAEGLTGNLLLWHLDRATAACSRVLHIRADHEAAQELQGRIKRLRERGIRERVSTDRRRLLRYAGVVVLAVTAVATLVVASLLAGEREDARRTEEAADVRIAAMRHDASAATREARHWRQKLGDGFAALADAQRARGRIGAARLAAAKALLTAETPQSWRALAAADAHWTPVLRRRLAIGESTAVEVSAAGDRLYSAGTAGVIEIRDVKSGEVVSSLRGEKEQTTVLREAAEGDVLYQGTASGRLHAWDLETGERAGTMEAEVADLEPSAVTALVTSPDGAVACSGHADGSIRVWSMFQLTARGARAHEAPVTSLAWPDLDDPWIYSGSDDGSVHKWKVFPLMLADIPCEVDEGGVTDLMVRDHSISVGTSGRLVLRLDETSGIQTGLLIGAPTGPHGLRFLSGGERVAVADAAGSLAIWSMERESVEARLDDLGEIRALHASRDGSTLVVVAAGGTAHVLALFRDAPGVRAMAHLCDSERRFFLVRPDRGVEVRNVRKPGPPLLLGIGAGGTAALTSDRDGGILFVATLDGVVQTWDAISGERFTTQIELDEPATALAYLEEADRLLTGTLDGAVYSWDWKRQRRATLARPGESPSPVTCLAVAKTTGHVFAARRDGKVGAWLPRSGETVVPWTTAGGWPVRLAVSPDGARYCLATGDGRLLIGSLLGSGSAADLRELKLPPEATPLTLRIDADGAVLWRSLEGRAWSWREGPAPSAGESRLDIRGAGPPWVSRDPLRRLIDVESRFGLKLVGFSVVPVDPEQHDPRGVRLQPWSED